MAARSVCLLGYGKVARDRHRPAWASLEGRGAARVVAVCEPNRDGARLAAQHFPQARIIREEASAVVTGMDADIVDICTPGHTHGELALQALRRGHDVLVEKPLCHSVEELDALVLASYGRAVNVCHTLRFSRPALSLVRSRDGGNLGDITRLSIVHHARHILSEAEWVTKARPDGVLFENAIHFVDLAHHLLGRNVELTIDAVKFYETAHRRVLTGFELLANDGAGRQASIDFLQDSLMHSALQSRILVSGSGADAELSFYPSGFRLMSGVQDPVHDLRAASHRLVGVVRDLRGRGSEDAHLVLARDLVTAGPERRPTLVPPTAVRGTIGLLEQLATLWGSASPPPSGGRPTVSHTPRFADQSRDAVPRPA